MDQQQKSGAWIAAGVLLVLLLIVSFLWISARQDLAEVLEDGGGNIAAQRDEVRRVCQGPDRDPSACENALDELADILREFSEDVRDAESE